MCSSNRGQTYLGSGSILFQNLDPNILYSEIGSSDFGKPQKSSFLVAWKKSWTLSSRPGLKKHTFFCGFPLLIIVSNHV